jgi:hypothetical protein
MKLLPLDLSRAETYNLIKNSSGNWASRPAYTNIATITAGGENGGQVCVYACSVWSNSGVLYNYVFVLTTSKQLQCRIYDSNWVLQSNTNVQVSQVDASAPVYHAQTPYNQIVFSSTGWTATLWCIVGNTPVVAQKQESINPGTPALPIPAGIVSSFGDRIVYCKDNGAYISSPGAECRTIVANNTQFVAGTITDAFENESGDFVIVSTAETRVFAQEGLVSAAYDGRSEKNKNYKGLRQRNACATKHGSFGLSKSGVINLDTMDVIPLAKYRRYKQITPIVGAGAGSDYRSQGKIFPFSAGLIVSLGAGKPIQIINFDEKYISMWDDTQTTVDFVGVCELEDGTPVLAYKNKIFALYGNDTSCSHYLAIDLPTPAIESTTIRQVIIQTLADGIQSITSYARDQSTTETPAQAEESYLNTTAVYDTAILRALEYQSVELEHTIRADTPWIEIQIGRDTEVLDAQIETNTQGSQRHRQ